MFIISSFSFHISVSVKRLREALRQVILKHAVLRSSMHYDMARHEGYQRIESLTDEGFIFVASVTDKNIEADRHLIKQECAPDLFDIKRGRLVRLHIIRHDMKQDENILVQGDIIILNVRHEAIDGTSETIFLAELAHAYQTEEQLPIKSSDAITYLDYTLHQTQIDMSASLAFWEKQFHDFDIRQHILHLPCDRPEHLESTPCVSPMHAFTFQLKDSTMAAMIECARENNVTLAVLCLTCHYAFLFEVTGLWDVAARCAMASRPLEPEAAGIIGPFVYYPLLRIHVDTNGLATFESLIRAVHTLFVNAVDHVRIEYHSLPTSDTLNGKSQFEQHMICTIFQFDESMESITLDKVNNVQLEQLVDYRDGFSETCWWRHFWWLVWNVNVLYNISSQTLSYAQTFSTRLYERTTGVSRKGL
jgi:hypothetical protein